jgi:hypothetical protein
MLLSERFLTVATKVPKTEYYDKNGNLIPPDNFDNDLPFEPEKIDKSPGSPYDRNLQRLKDIEDHNPKDTGQNS